ncbi:MAG: cysteine desulfurase [Gammaproteobacteria bacterium]|nr:cysteine desulfurase [Gammaproteobacteria bacterium]
MPVYLDNNATTQLDPRVLDAMDPYLLSVYGNGSSLHRYGRLIRSAIEQAREQLAAAVKAHPDQIVFTSGGTEANNLVLKGVAAHSVPAKMLVSAIEHTSVREPALALRKDGWIIGDVPVLNSGLVDLAALSARIDTDTRLVSVMLANNETGAIQPVQQVAEISRRAGAVLHSDASQALGKYPVDFAASGAQIMTFSAHKLHGPLGAGAVVIDRSVLLQAQQRGGKHEFGLRAGTENVAAIVGFGMAAYLATIELSERRRYMQQLRDQLENELRRIPEVCIFAEQTERLPNTTQFGLHGCHGETLLLKLDRAGIAVSSGSACHSDVREPSHVLVAMDVEPELAMTAIRVSLSKQTTVAEIKQFVDALTAIVGEFRKTSVRAVNA